MVSDKAIYKNMHTYHHYIDNKWTCLENIKKTLRYTWVNLTYKYSLK